VQLMASIKDIATAFTSSTDAARNLSGSCTENDTLSGFESKIYRKDGTIIWIAENCRAVRDAQGKLLYYEGTVEDITERKRAEEQIRRAPVNSPAAARNCAPRIHSWRKICATAREIQLTMLPQQYPTFPHGSTTEQSAFNLSTATSRRSPSARFFSISAFPTPRSACSSAT